MFVPLILREKDLAPLLQNAAAMDDLLPLIEASMAAYNIAKVTGQVRLETRELDSEIVRAWAHVSEAETSGVIGGRGCDRSCRVGGEQRHIGVRENRASLVLDDAGDSDTLRGRLVRSGEDHQRKKPEQDHRVIRV